MSTFSQLGLSEARLKAVQSLGFETPTEIQLKAIPVLLAGTRDFIGLAQTGTGKTAAFGLPLLDLVDYDSKFSQALILCPTRELCVQISQDLNEFSKPRKNTNVAVYGGASITMQIKQIKQGPPIVVATPGRLIDLIERKAIDLNRVHYVILDEADEMLNMGFREDIDHVLKHTPARKSTWLFSATMPDDVRQISKRYMTRPSEITVGNKNQTNKSIDHQYFVTQSSKRYETLRRLIDFNPGMYAIVFARTKNDTQEVTERLQREGYDVEALHGDLTQQQRDRVMKRFKQKTLQILLATDVAARGIDVDGITHVINYELPDDIESYTHRSGRTARAGKTGICISIVHSREIYKLKQIEKVSKASIKRMDIPSGSDVCRKQFFHFMTNLAQNNNDEGVYNEYLPDVMPLFEGLSKEDILKKIASHEFNHFMKYYEDAEDLNVKAENISGKKGLRNESGTRGRERFISDNGYVSLFVTLGTKDGLYKAAFLQYILDESRLKKDVLGKINLRDTFTTFEIDKDYAKKMISALEGKSFNGREIFIRYDNQGNANRGSNFGSGNKNTRDGNQKSFNKTNRKTSGVSKKFYKNDDFGLKDF